MVRRTIGKLFVIIFLCSVFIPFLAQAGEFELRINDMSGIDSPWPLIGSMAFAKGELKDASTIRIISEGK